MEILIQIVLFRPLFILLYIKWFLVHLPPVCSLLLFCMVFGIYFKVFHISSHKADTPLALGNPQISAPTGARHGLLCPLRLVSLRPALASSFSCHNSSWPEPESPSKALVPQEWPPVHFTPHLFSTLLEPLFLASSNLGLGIFIWFLAAFGSVVFFSLSLTLTSAFLLCR